MPLLNFKKQFVPSIENGTKRQTVRAKRKKPIKVGDTLYLYTGLRTKQTKRIANAICTELWEIRINNASIVLCQESETERFMELLTGKQLDDMAILDGFKDWQDMKQFWVDTHGLPFTGNLIKFKIV